MPDREFLREHVVHVHVQVPPPPERECLDAHKGGCSGGVAFRPSLTGTGTSIPRCDAHWSARLDWQSEHNAIYPDGPTPPCWFDPEAAGERWDDD